MKKITTDWSVAWYAFPMNVKILVAKAWDPLRPNRKMTPAYRATVQQISHETLAAAVSTHDSGSPADIRFDLLNSYICYSIQGIITLKTTHELLHIRKVLSPKNFRPALHAPKFKASWYLDCVSAAENGDQSLSLQCLKKLSASTCVHCRACVLIAWNIINEKQRFFFILQQPHLKMSHWMAQNKMQRYGVISFAIRLLSHSGISTVLASTSGSGLLLAAFEISKNVNWFVDSNNRSWIPRPAIGTYLCMTTLQPSGWPVLLRPVDSWPILVGRCRSKRRTRQLR